MTRNKNNLPINFCTTGNFLNLSKIKFIPFDKSLKVNSKKNSKKNSLSNLSDTIPKKEISKDEIIKQLKERIIFLENKIKLLEKEIESNKKERKNWNNKTLILKMNNWNKALNQMNKITTIPLDKNLLKTKLYKKKKNLFELLDVNKVIKKNRSNSFNLMELNMSKMSKHNNKNNSINSINNSISNYYTNNNSSVSSALKTKKKSINLINKSNSFGSLHNLLYCISSKSSKSKISSSIEHKKRKNFGEMEKKVTNLVGRKINIINGIPKKGRKNFNASPKLMMMSSTNYSNNVSNSFKDEINMKKYSPKKVYNNSSFCEKNSIYEIKNKLENIQNRTKNLLKLYYSLNFDKIGINKFNINIIKEKFFANYSHYVKISKLEKHKKD